MTGAFNSIIKEQRKKIKDNSQTIFTIIKSIHIDEITEDNGSDMTITNIR
jgi:hypothetical protein